MVQSQPESEPMVDVLQDVEGIEIQEIFVRIGAEDGIIKPFVIETDHQVRFLKVLQEIVDLFLGVCKKTVFKA